MLRFTWLFLLFFTLPISACSPREFVATPLSLHNRIGPGDTHQGIRLLGALRLPAAEIDGLALCGLSGLAWDEDAELLYALSDRGHLFHLEPIFDQRGYLAGARAVAGYPLRDAIGRPLGRPFFDAEGLAIRNGANGIPDDAELLVSFEGKPRVVGYRPTGQWRGEEPLPLTLRNIHNYRSGNEALEAVALDPRRGILSGSETPLRNDPPGLIRIFASTGRFWLYPLGSAPGSALVAMEALPDGSLLTLERAFVSPLRPFSISLRHTELPLRGKLAPLRVRDVAVFKTDQGWLLDNFEGLTRQREQRFFMVSDDNCSTLQMTLLVYFEILSAPRYPSCVETRQSRSGGGNRRWVSPIVPAPMPELVDKD